MVQVLDNYAYLVKVDGSGRVLKRNRRHLRQIVPYPSVLSAPRPTLNLSRAPQNLGGTPSAYAELLKEPNNLTNSNNSSTNFLCSGVAAERAFDQSQEQNVPEYDDSTANNATLQPVPASPSAMSDQHPEPVSYSDAARNQTEELQ